MVVVVVVVDDVVEFLFMLWVVVLSLNFSKMFKDLSQFFSFVVVLVMLLLLWGVVVMLLISVVWLLVKFLVSDVLFACNIRN